MLNVQLVEDGSTVASDRYVTQTVNEHLVHSTWTESGLDHLGHDSSCTNVASLSILSTITRGSFFQNQNRLICEVRHLVSSTQKNGQPDFRIKTLPLLRRVFA